MRIDSLVGIAFQDMPFRHGALRRAKRWNSPAEAGGAAVVNRQASKPSSRARASMRRFTLDRARTGDQRK